MYNRVEPFKYDNASHCFPLLFRYKRCSFCILIQMNHFFLLQATIKEQSQCFSYSHPQVSVTNYVSERYSATNLNLHVCLFTGEEDTARCPPPRYATRTETARALSGLAHAGNGRFLWMTETGEKTVSE